MTSLPDSQQAAGLLLPSIATAILRTIKRTMIHRKLGAMVAADLQAFDRQIREVLAL